MLAEVINALFLTYVATEYMLASSRRGSSAVDVLKRLLLQSNLNRIALLIVVLVNLVERYHLNYREYYSSTKSVFSSFFKVPRILIAAIAYMVVLYLDCKRVTHSSITLPSFVKRVGVAFLKVAPAYPFLAVIISFVFLFIISAFEALGLNENILNMPIYYGTVYGPFSFVYWNVKSRVVYDHLHSLPSTSTTNNKRTDTS